MAGCVLISELQGCRPPLLHLPEGRGGVEPGGVGLVPAHGDAVDAVLLGQPVLAEVQLVVVLGNEAVI